MERAVILAAFLVVGAHAVPTGSREGATCSVTCPVVTDGGGLYYEQGMTYVYNYASDVETTISGSTEEASRLHATAKVLLTSDGACDLQIQLTDVTLKDSHPKESSIKTEVERMGVFKQQLEEKPLRFSYQNGAVDHICPEPDEPVWVLNFKRAIISMVVSRGVDAKDHTFDTKETDISGECDTSYTIERNYFSTQTTKVKNLLSCKQRGHLISSLQTTPYRSSSPIQSSPILSSTLQCEQRVENQRVVHAVCREQHQFRPFSRGSRGAVTATNTQWQEEGVLSDGGLLQGIGSRHVRLSPIFDIRDPVYHQVNDIDPLLDVLGQLDDKTSQEVRPEAPRLFTQLVESVRHLDYASLRKANKEIISPKQRQSFLTALSMAGTSSSIAMMRDSVLNNDISQAEQDRFLISLAFVHEPSLDMVKALTPLLAVDDVSKQTLLGVSSLVHEYCKKNPACIDEDPVRAVVTALENLLPTDCYARSEDEVTKTIAALKAIGNIGRTVNSKEMLIKCIISTDNKVEVRLASVNAFKRMPCSSERRETLMDIFSNDREDTEIRIAAYLSLMQCPNYYNIEKIGELLSKESVNQVSSFIWTHLSNLKESNDPAKHFVKSLLSKMDLKNKFNTDIRKFSRYFEKSMYLNSMNTGASVEGTVVFSPESYVPRSAMVNLTLDLFGEAINLFEIGGRVEGMDDLAHDFFGTSRFLPTQALSNFWQYFSSGPDTSSLAANTPKLSTYWKVFGNELGFNRYDSLSQFSNALEIKNPLDAIKYLVQEKDLTENTNILDSTYIVSTIAGFPFSLRAVGSASVSLKTGGNYNVQSWNKLDINGYLKPSASVEIVGEMGVDAFAARTGLKMVSNLHTSTAIDGSLTVDGGSVIVGKINMPKERNEVLDVTTRFYSMHKNRVIPLGMNADDVYQNKICSGSVVDRLLGLKFCTNFQITNPSSNTPSLLLSGPIDAQIYIMKTDSIKAFTFEFRNVVLDDLYKNHLLIHAPGSTVDRRISFDLRHNYESEIEASLHTPIKSFDASGVLQTQGPTKVFKLNLVVDKTDEYAVKSQYRFETGENGWTVEPSMLIIGNSRELIQIEGSASADFSEGAYGLGAKFITPYNTPIKIKAGYRASENMHTFTQSLSCSFLDMDQTSVVKLSDNEVQFDTDIDYIFLGSPRQNIFVGVKLSSDKQVESLKTCTLSTVTQFTSMPYLDTELKLIRTKSPTKCHTLATLLHDDRIYTAEAGFDLRDELVGTKLKLTAQHWGVDVLINGDVDLSKPGVFKFDGTTRLTDSIKAATKLIVRAKASDLGFDYGVESQVSLPSSSYALELGVRRELSAGHIKFMVAREILGEREEIKLISLIALEERNTELEITLFVPNVPRLQLFGRLTSGDQGVYGAGAGVTYGDLEYRSVLEYRSAEGSGDHALTVLLTCPGHDLRLSSAAQLQHHEQVFSVDYVYGRKVVATLVTRPSENSLTGDLSVHWDKNEDDSKVLTAAIKAKRLTREFSVSVNYPGQQYDLTGQLKNNRFSAELQYGSKRIHTEVSAEIKSPTDVLLTAALTTPFEGYRKMSLMFSNKPDISDSPRASKLVNFDLTGEMNEKVCRLTGQVISGLSTDKRHSLHAVLDLSSHLQGWERVHFDTTVYAEDGMYSARAAASMNEYSAGIGVLHEVILVDGSPKLRSELDIKLPLEQLKVVKLSLLCKVESTRVESEIVALWVTDIQKQTSVGLDLSYNPEMHMYYDASLLVRTPFGGHEEYYTRALVKSQIDDYALLLTLQNPESAKIFHTELNLATDSEEKLQANGNLVIIAYKNIGFNLDTFLNEKLARLDFDGFSDNSNISLKFHQTSPNLFNKDFHLALRTPYGHHYSYARSLEISVSPSLYTDQVKITWDDKAIQLDLQGVWKTKMIGDQMESMELAGRGGLTTPFIGWELSNVTQEFLLEMNEGIKLTGYSSCSVNDKIIELIQNVDIKGNYDWSSNGTIKSNTDLFTNTHYSVGLYAQSYNDGKFYAAMKRGEKHLEILYNHKIFDEEPGFKIQVSGNAKCTDRGVVSFDMNAVFDDDDDLVIEAFAECPNGKHSIDLRVDSEDDSSSSNMTIESPFFEKITLKEYESIKEDIHYSLVVSHGNDVYSLDVNTVGDLSSNAEIAINLNSPRNVFGQIDFNTLYAVSSEISAKSQININNWISTLGVKFAPTEGEINVTTPEQYLRELRASIRLKDESLKMVLTHEKRQMVLTVMRTDMEQYDGVHLHLTTPFRGFEILSLTALKHVNQHDYKLNYSRGRFETFSLAASAIGERYVLAADITNKLVGQAEIEFLMDLIRYKFGINVLSNGEGAKLGANLKLADNSVRFYANYNNDLLRGPKKILFDAKTQKN
nr:MTTP-like protein [Parasacculina yatsui]